MMLGESSGGWFMAIVRLAGTYCRQFEGSARGGPANYPCLCRVEKLYPECVRYITTAKLSFSLAFAALLTRTFEAIFHQGYGKVKSEKSYPKGKNPDANRDKACVIFSSV